MNPWTLIRKYEPVLLFSQDDDGRDERFFPLSVAHYVAEAALHRQGEGEVRPRGALTLDALGRYPPRESRELYLTFAADEVLKHDPSLRERLAHGGLSLYNVDGVMTPSLVVDSAPGLAFATADPGLAPQISDAALSFSGPAFEPAAGPAGPGAAETGFTLTDTLQLPEQIYTLAQARYAPYRDFAAFAPVYYYNVLLNRGYLVLQYWFFYAYNDWGSGHSGVNDHEGDWEMIMLFLRDEEPVYVAYSAHTGAPTWHEWTDPVVEKEGGTHPRVYVGCGSHAGYFSSGAHTILGFKDCSYGNSTVAIGPGTGVPWGKPEKLAGQPWVVNYGGGWGALLRRLGFSWLAPGAQAPLGPAWQFVRWESPVGWARIPH